MEPNAKNEDETLRKESVDGRVSNRRKRVHGGQPGEVEVAQLKKRKGCGGSNENKKNHGNTIERWSAERYKLAEENMFRVMKDLGATCSNPVTRPVLRKEARVHIGDTGLLDHLLKQMDGKVMPGGTERFRRCFNTSGVMEYWLENADLVDEREEPHRIPTNRLMPGGGDVEASVSAAEFAELKSELTNLKREMGELVGWRVSTELRANENESCVRSAQAMLSGELMIWKAKVEQQLAETKSSLSSLQALKQDNACSSPITSRWDKWFGNNDFHGDEDRLWFEEPDPDDSERRLMAKEASFFSFRRGDDPIPEDQRNAAELVPKKEEQPPRGTPYSAAIEISKPELNASFARLEELFEWKPKLERELAEVSESVREMQARIL